MKIHKLTLAALLVAIGTLSAHLIYIPAGISKCFPVQHAKAAMAGEIFGTGILGGLTAWVIARFFLNSAAAAWFFIPPFLISTVGGSIIAGLIIKSGILAYALPNLFANKGNKSNL